ncbi:hypothetical protein PC123_g467 [Phytophthora cactorum]|nr:hypothetical protein PC120_g89 [Phytophthora cactorum]KAG4064755.1 hypothetical protein PC123_g467 [Phytophthora cactorum]
MHTLREKGKLRSGCRFTYPLVVKVATIHVISLAKFK